jgi:hypothetical protein
MAISKGRNDTEKRKSPTRIDPGPPNQEDLTDFETDFEIFSTWGGDEENEKKGARRGLPCPLALTP